MMRAGTVELCCCRAEPFDESALLEIVLATVGHDKGLSTANTGHRGKRRLKNVDTCGVGPHKRSDQRKPQAR